jgi:hypothetical protein
VDGEQASNGLSVKGGLAQAAFLAASSNYTTDAERSVALHGAVNALCPWASVALHFPAYLLAPRQALVPIALAASMSLAHTLPAADLPRVSDECTGPHPLA